MNIKTAEFVKGIIGTDKILEDGKPQIVFIGRSNVGKSSVINSLVQRNNLVKSSSVPGKTQQINFFLINKEIYFVDLPGYGFIKISPKKKEKIRKMMLWYLFRSKVKFKKTVLIIDIKVGPNEFDIGMFDLLNKHNYEIVVVANKVDKLKQGEINRQLKLFQEKINANDILLYSATTKKGRDELLKAIFN